MNGVGQVQFPSAVCWQVLDKVLASVSSAERVALVGQFTAVAVVT